MRRKVVIPRLNQEEKKSVRSWLRTLYKRTTCPFYTFDRCKEECKVCYEAFPLITRDKYGYVRSCPCAEYNLDTVIKRAKEMLRCQ